MIDELYGELLSLVRIIGSKFHQQKPSTRGKKIKVLRSLSLEPVDNTSLKTFKPDRTEPQYLRNMIGCEERISIPQSNKGAVLRTDRKSTRLNSSHRCISYAVFCLKKKKNSFII